MGDATPLGWLITVGYLLTAVRSILAARAAKSFRSEATAHPWWWIAGFALLLGINKQMDFQTLFIEWGRAASRSLGAYEHRRLIERGFLIVAGISVLLLMAHWIRHYRGFVRGHWLLFCGVAVILVRCGLRAAGILHAGDETDDALPRLGLIEALGVSLMLAGAGASRKCPSTPGTA